MGYGVYYKKKEKDVHFCKCVGGGGFNVGTININMLYFMMISKTY